MERVGALIDRLTEQYLQNAGPDKMLVTLHILAAELEVEKGKMAPKARSVSVVAPSFLRKPVPVEETVAPIPVAKPAVQPVEIPKRVVEAPPAEAPAARQVPLPFSYDPVKDIPTLAAQKQKDGPELNELMATKEESLNERLKNANIELGAVLQAAPVKDLKKGIGINDRYVFLNELFRGDEAMYERSIKTINGFTNFAEAEFWIKRELKVKLGWSEDANAVTQFDQLVRRRFS